MTNLAQTKAIHALRRDLGEAFTDADYRAAIGRVKRGAISSKELTFHEAGKLIEELKRLGARIAPTRRASELVDGPYAGKLRALWIALWNLGAVRNNDDRALAAFAKRQAKVDHTRFLVDPAAAAKVIEALKAMLIREGVPAEALDGETIEAKRAVAKAVAKKCYDTGAFTPFIKDTPFERPDEPGRYACWPNDFESFGSKNGNTAGFEFYDGPQWDHLASRLGYRLRAHLKKAGKQAKQEAA